MTVSSVVGQSVVGQFVDLAAWLQPSHWELTQGWGQTNVTVEPSGHGYRYWHAGADIGCDCGTVLILPPEIVTARVKAVDNPGGYGTALVITIRPIAGLRTQQAKGIDIWLGHLASRLVPDGQVRGGTHLATTNNTGNSEGCHLHFEVRPEGGKYGTDLDPSLWLLNPTKAASDLGAAVAGTGSDPITAAIEAALAPVATSISDASQRAVAAFVGGAQVGLGAGIMLGGLGLVGFGLRGQSLRQAAGFARSRAAGLSRQPAKPAAPARPRRLSAGELEERLREYGMEGPIDRRQALAWQAGERRNTIGAYRAGLVSQAETQRRLGLPVRRVGRRASRLGFTRGTPGVYRARGGGSVELRAAQVRASRVKGAKMPTAPAPALPRAPEGPIPF